jgi:hypothetical protein
MIISPSNCGTKSINFSSPLVHLDASKPATLAENATSPISWSLKETKQPNEDLVLVKEDFNKT